MCHYVQLSKIQGMKSISKPRLPIEIYTFQEIISTNDYRKESSFFLESFAPLPNLTLTPAMLIVNPWMAGETEMTAFAGEGQEIFMLTIRALHPRKAVVQVATFQAAGNDLLK